MLKQRNTKRLIKHKKDLTCLLNTVLVSEQIPGTDIPIGPGLSANELVEISYRSRLDAVTASKKLGYSPRFTSWRDGIADYLAMQRRYLAETKVKAGP